MDRIEKAINTIIAENGGEVVAISEDRIVIRNSMDIERIYSYEVKDDIITIKNKNNQIVFEKFIQSYQKPFSFTINKK